MPKRTDIKSVMVIGSGPIVIGQAAEFDYSGTQACRVLREEGIRVILVNSNPATIMTDPEMADATYIEPISTPILEQIIAKERPDALLPTLGGQTALNAAMALGEAGVLKKYNVELIGASLEAIDRGEDRELFKKVVEEAGAESARSDIAHSIEEVDKIAEKFGYPLVVRPSFTMGGLGSGIAHDEEELHRIAGAGIHYSPTDEVLIEEGIEGWKEYELELMRDKKDNVVVVCPIENVDPVGVHTGDSITVAPVFTLTDREYQKLRDIGIAIIRGVGVDTGGCNIQFAINPNTGRIIVIEMNPRVSRSSALASKATGFPIAKIATKLALGYTLDEIQNDITQSTPASFEPTIDYVVTKVPRFAFEKFPGADPTLTTSMKSVGEAMALAGNFQESLGKAMRSIDKRHMGFNWDGDKPDVQEVEQLLEAIKVPTEHRYLQIQRALWGGATEQQIFDATKIDPWFIRQFVLINETALEIKEASKLSRKLLKKAKLAGLSDLQIAHLRHLGDEGENTIRELRWSYDLRPVFKTVDTCAAEFDAVTPYYYSCYADESELRPREREAVIILGSGPNRIGQGIEFSQGHLHFYNFCAPNTPDKEFLDELIRRGIEGGRILGIKWLVIHAATDFDSVTPVRDSKRKTIEYLKPRIELAGKYGVGIAVENLWEENIAPKRRYCVTAEELGDLVDSLPYDNVGCCWDVEHASICHQDQRKALQYLGKRLKATHISDYNSIKNDHILPFSGLSDWKEITDALRLAQYDGDFTYETHNFTAKMPDEVIMSGLKHSIDIGNLLIDMIQGGHQA